MFLKYVLLIFFFLHFIFKWGLLQPKFNIKLFCVMRKALKKNKCNTNSFCSELFRFKNNKSL